MCHCHVYYAICVLDKGKVEVPSATNKLNSESNPTAPTSTVVTNNAPSEDTSHAVSWTTLCRTRQMIIIIRGKPNVHGVLRHAKRKGGVYCMPVSIMCAQVLSRMLCVRVVLM